MSFINQIEPWLGEEEKRALVAYLESGGWLTEFRKTREFENAIAAFTGARYVSVVTNGTLSLVAALMACQIGAGDEVIVPDFTMIASANAVVLAGATPVLVDISRDHLCLDIDRVISTITPRTRAIMLVSLNGRCPNIQLFVDLCQERGLFLIEDAAQSLGSRYKEQHLGTFGHIGSFSFSAPKIITTGQGGALVTNDEVLYQRILKIKDFGRPESGVDYHEVMGFNFKFTDLQAVIGIEQMRKLDWRVQRKKEIYRQYQEFLTNTSEVEFIPTDLNDTSPWFIDVLVSDPMKLRAFLKSKGIGSRPFYPAIHTQPPYSIRGDYPVSDHVAAHGLWLPSSSFLSDHDIRFICDEISGFYNRFSH